MAPSRTDDGPSTYVAPLPASMPTKKLAERKHEGNRLLHRSFTNPPVHVDSAKGVELYLSNGETIIDACAGAAVAIVGHANDEVNAAMMAQAQKVSYLHNQAYTNAPAEDLANIILEGSPAGLEMACFYGSGSEAVEAALKLAKQYHYDNGQNERVHFVSRGQAYHGNTISALSVSTNVARKIPYKGFGYPHISHVSPAFPYRYMKESETEEQYTQRLLQEIEDEFLRIGPEKVIAFMAESVIGATAGCVLPPKGYLRGVREVCDKYGILLILDEIMCGTGRCGTYFAFEQEGESVRPDIVTVAKGLGGGYAPISGVLIGGKVLDVLRAGSGAFVHAHTYQAHPTSCASALAVQKIIRRDRLVERCAELGKVLEAKLRSELKDCRSVGDIRGRGLFWAVEFVTDRETKDMFDPAIGFGAKVHQAAFERGVAVYPGAGTYDGKRGDHVLLAPPFIVTEDQLDTICKVLREAIESQEQKYLA